VRVVIILSKRGHFWCIMGAFRNSSAPIPHDSLHSSPYYLKGPWTAATGKQPETRGHPGYNDKSKDHPRAHERRIKSPQDLSFRYPWDSVSRSHKTSKFCMLHTRPCGTHNAPTIDFDIPLKKTSSSLSVKSFPQELLKNKYIVVMGGLIQRSI
jgi:hypothetical protein